MDVPPLPAFTSLKGHAAEQRDFYYDAAWGMAHMLAIYGALEIIGSFADPADGILWITQQLAGAITVDPGQEAVRVLFNLSAYHQGAANLGLSEAELEAMRADFLAIQYTFNEADFLALIDEIQTVNTALMTDLNTLSANMAPITLSSMELCQESSTIAPYFRFWPRPPSAYRGRPGWISD